MIVYDDAYVQWLYDEAYALCQSLDQTGGWQQLGGSLPSLTDLFLYDVAVLSECLHPKAKVKNIVRLAVPSIFLALKDLDIDLSLRNHAQARLFHYFGMRGEQLLMSYNLNITFTKIYLEYMKDIKNLLDP